MLKILGTREFGPATVYHTLAEPLEYTAMGIRAMRITREFGPAIVCHTHTMRVRTIVVYTRMATVVYADMEIWTAMWTARAR